MYLGGISACTPEAKKTKLSANVDLNFLFNITGAPMWVNGSLGSPASATMCAIHRGVTLTGDTYLYRGKEYPFNLVSAISYPDRILYRHFLLGCFIKPLS